MKIENQFQMVCFILFKRWCLCLPLTLSVDSYQTSQKACFWFWCACYSIYRHLLLFSFCSIPIYFTFYWNAISFNWMKISIQKLTNIPHRYISNTYWNTWLNNLISQTNHIHYISSNYINSTLFEWYVWPNG